MIRNTLWYWICINRPIPNYDTVLYHDINTQAGWYLIHQMWGHILEFTFVAQIGFISRVASTTIPQGVKFHPLFEPAKLDVELIKVLSAKRMSSGFFLDKLSHLSNLVYCLHIFTILGVGGAASMWWWCKINFCGDCDPAWPRGADPPWDPSSSHTTLLDFPAVR